MPSGLSSDEARALFAKCGANEVPDTAMRPWRVALAKFWAPVPWLLEAAILLQLVLHEYTEAAVIAGLLVFNAALGFFNEGRAGHARRFEIAPGADSVRAARWRLEEHPREGARAG